MLELLDYRVKKRELRTPGKLVDPADLHADEFSANLARMREILELDGVGLAATQVGWPVQLFMLCIDEEDNKIEPQIFLNPKILKSSKEQVKMEEGCLSFRGLFLAIKRPETIEWEYQTPDGQTIIKKSAGFYARAVQHEVDHCQGKVFIDKASSVMKLKVKKWLQTEP